MAHLINNTRTSYFMELVEKLGLSAKTPLTELFKQATKIAEDKENTPEIQTTATVLCNQFHLLMPGFTKPEEIEEDEDFPLKNFDMHTAVMKLLH